MDQPILQISPENAPAKRWIDRRRKPSPAISACGPICFLLGTVGYFQSSGTPTALFFCIPLGVGIGITGHLVERYLKARLLRRRKR